MGSELSTPGTVSAVSTGLAAPEGGLSPASTSSTGIHVDAASEAPTASLGESTTAVQVGTARRYEIVSSNFRLASRALDGYDAWANQVLVLSKRLAKLFTLPCVFPSRTKCLP